MSKQASKPATDPKDLLRLDFEDYPGKSQERVLAEIALSPVFANALTARRYSKGNFGENDLTGSVEALQAKVAKVMAGDLSEMEALLVAQATALDTIFTELARRAALNMGEYINATDTYLRLALKAQSQCRTTVEALAELKNPRHVAFVKQANIAHGPQQVNNGGQAPASREKFANPSNELSGGTNELLPDARASKAQGRANHPVEAVGEVDRPTDKRGQVNKLPQQS